MRDSRSVLGDSAPTAPARQAPPRRATMLPSPLTIGVIALIAIAAATILLTYIVSGPVPAPELPPDPMAVTDTPLPPPSGAPPAPAKVTAPALSRFAREEAAAAVDQAAPPAPRPAQLIAARRIADNRREELRREEVASLAAERAKLRPIAPRLAPPGRVVFLGTFATKQQGEAAAKRYRFRYRGLLATLPKAVTPFKPTGTAPIVYRVQFVVPNQAYAEITCQRLRAAGKSCTVIY